SMPVRFGRAPSDSLTYDLYSWGGLCRIRRYRRLSDFCLKASLARMAAPGARWSVDPELGFYSLCESVDARHDLEGSRATSSGAFSDTDGAQLIRLAVTTN